MNADTDYGVVLVTTNSQEEATELARKLVTERLAACVSLYPSRSVYRWQGELEESAEWQLLIKTQLRQFPRLAARIRELHSYDVPEIIALPIVAGSQPYLDWLGEQVRDQWLIDGSIEV
jgi:periplasmic divalent cation tolerance protein